MHTRSSLNIDDTSIRATQLRSNFLRRPAFTLSGQHIYGLAAAAAQPPSILLLLLVLIWASPEHQQRQWPPWRQDRRHRWAVNPSIPLDVVQLITTAGLVRDGWCGVQLGVGPCTSMLLE